MPIGVTSTAFAAGEAIPTRYTCDADNVSPPLAWTGIPKGTQSIALIADDPDAPAGTWVHWVAYGLSPDATGLPEGVPDAETLENGARQGTNDFRHIGYGGPCPPPGRPHRYCFKVYALDFNPDLKPGATKQDLETAMQGHILDEGQLIGTYQRRK